jgi:hypothetical protein
MKPVARKHCELYQLKDGTYTIDDLADFHEMMDETDEYERRAREAAEKDK